MPESQGTVSAVSPARLSQTFLLNDISEGQKKSKPSKRLCCFFRRGVTGLKPGLNERWTIVLRHDPWLRQKGRTMRSALWIVTTKLSIDYSVTSVNLVTFIVSPSTVPSTLTRTPLVDLVFFKTSSALAFPASSNL